MKAWNYNYLDLKFFLCNQPIEFLIEWNFKEKIKMIQFKCNFVRTYGSLYLE